jgi:DNA-binding PadR family transcriptional regulator
MEEDIPMNDSDDRLEYYLSIGAISLEGVDENGEIIYAITELAEELAPELWESHIEHIDKSLIELYKEGLLSIDYDENLDVTFTLSPEGHKKAKEYGLVEILNKNIPNN